MRMAGYKPISARNSPEDEELQKFNNHLDPLLKEEGIMMRPTMFNDSNLPHEIYPLFRRGYPGEGGVVEGGIGSDLCGLLEMISTPNSLKRSPSKSKQN
jgi:hypothetical protein